MKKLWVEKEVRVRWATINGNKYNSNRFLNNG